MPAAPRTAATRVRGSQLLLQMEHMKISKLKNIRISVAKIILPISKIFSITSYYSPLLPLADDVPVCAPAGAVLGSAGGEGAARVHVVADLEAREDQPHLGRHP